MSQSGEDDNNADNSIATSTTPHLKALKSYCCDNDPDNIAVKTLSDLNDDCLDEILKYLNLCDQINLAQTCTHLQHFLLNCNKNRSKKLILTELLHQDLREHQKFFPLLGQSVRHIQGTELDCYEIISFDDFLNIIAKYFKNFKILIFRHVTVSTNHLNKVLSGIDKIVELRLAFCHLTDNSILELRKLHCLKILDLNDNFDLTGKYFNTLSKTIEILSLLGCSGLNIDNFHAFCESLTNLKKLNLKFCFYDIREIDWKILKNLEVLEITSRCIDFWSLAKLPKLKVLSITMDSDYGGFRNLSVFVSQRGEQLKHLIINGAFNLTVAQQISQLHGLRMLSFPKGNRIGITELQYICNLKNLEEIDLSGCGCLKNTTVMRLVLGCSKLKRINLRRCLYITQNLIFDLIKELKEQTKLNPYKYQRPIVIIMPYALMEEEEDVLKHPEYLAAKDILRIEFMPYS